MVITQLILLSPIIFLFGLQQNTITDSNWRFYKHRFWGLCTDASTCFLWYLLCKQASILIPTFYILPFKLYRSINEAVNGKTKFIPAFWKMSRENFMGNVWYQTFDIKKPHIYALSVIFLSDGCTDAECLITTTRTVYHCILMSKYMCWCVGVYA